jgi:hypothetical protein
MDCGELPNSVICEMTKEHAGLCYEKFKNFSLRARKFARQMVSQERDFPRVGADDHSS